MRFFKKKKRPNILEDIQQKEINQAQKGKSYMRYLK